MFGSIYKTTLKNILRSPTFLMLTVVLVLITVWGAVSGFYVGDDAPDMVLGKADYVECTENACSSKLMLYSVPIFVAFITVLILQRDYGDAFFEIEKASGIQAVKYVLGRLTALLTVSFVLMFAMNLLLIHWYVFSRGGVADMSLADYLFDSFWRVLMLDFLIALPGILFYIAFTYLVGSLFQNGIAAAIASVGYALCHYVSFLILWSDLPAVLFDYLSPTPLKLRRYFRLFGTEWFEASVKNNGTTLGDALFCIIFLVSVTILFSAVSCMKVQKRSV